MSSWRDINKDSWTFTKKLIVGYGGGIGPYQTSYAISRESEMLNGRIFADIKLSDRHASGAGLVCRANDQWTFLAFYTAPGDSGSESTTARLGLFKEGVFSQLLALPEEVFLDKSYNRFTLEFYSGNIRGEIRTGEKIHEMTCSSPHIPFPGYAGLVKFYGAAVRVKNVTIEATEMRFRQEVNEEMDDFAFKVFVCHSSADMPVVKDIVQQFRREDITYWLDSEQIKYGDSVIQKIEEGLQNSRYVVPCMSKNLTQSGWTQAEFRAILNSEFSGNNKRIVVPLKLEDCTDADIPILLRDKKRVAYGNKMEFAEFLKFLKQ